MILKTVPYKTPTLNRFMDEPIRTLPTKAWLKLRLGTVQTKYGLKPDVLEYIPNDLYTWSFVKSTMRHIQHYLGIPGPVK